MAKPEKYSVAGYDFFFWDYEEQTMMKHKVLATYLPVWAQKLGKYYPLAFFDCHGGCGAYVKDGTAYWGSSIIIAQIASELAEKYKKDITIYVAEEDRENIDNLIRVIEHLNLSTKPRLEHSDFRKALLSKAAVDAYSSKPSFFFVDPFGYNCSFLSLMNVMNYAKNELMVNFMFNAISRFISIPGQERNFDDFFGTCEWRDAIPLSGWSREQKLVTIYRNQLKKVAKFVFAYKISFYDKERTYYYLFHATDHVDGCSIMKSCFASVNNGKVEYLGNRTGNYSLFDVGDVKTQEIQVYLSTRLRGKEIAFIDIIEKIIDETFFLEKEIRAALHDMEKQQIISITRITSKRRGISGYDKIRFERSAVD